MAQEQNDAAKVPGTVYCYLTLGKLEEKRVYRIGRTKKIYDPVEQTRQNFVESLFRGAGLNKPREVIIVFPVSDLEKGWEGFRDIVRGNICWAGSVRNKRLGFNECIAGDCYYTVDWEPDQVQNSV